MSHAINHNHPSCWFFFVLLTVCKSCQLVINLALFFVPQHSTVYYVLNYSYPEIQNNTSIHKKPEKTKSCCAIYCASQISESFFIFWACFSGTSRNFLVKYCKMWRDRVKIDYLSIFTTRMQFITIWHFRNNTMNLIQ